MGDVEKGPFPVGTCVRTAYGQPRYGLITGVKVFSEKYWEADVLWQDAPEKGPSTIAGHALSTNVSIVIRVGLLDMAA